MPSVMPEEVVILCKRVIHIHHEVNHSYYHLLYKEMKLHLSHMYYWDVIPPYLLVYNRGKRDP